MNNFYNYNFYQCITDDMLQEESEDPGSQQVKKTVYGETN